MVCQSAPLLPACPHPCLPLSPNRLVTHYATYLVELTLPEASMLKYPPSIISASAVYAANVALGR
jgi:hypothetical protein